MCLNLPLSVSERAVPTLSPWRTAGALAPGCAPEDVPSPAGQKTLEVHRAKSS